MIIRKASVYDASGISKVHYEMFMKTYSNIYPENIMENIDFDKIRRKWMKILTDDNEVLVVESNDGGIIGFIKADIYNDREYDSEISAIFLLDEYHQTGLGKELFFESLKRLVEYKCKSTIVWCNKDNSSIKFYESIGGEIFDTKIDRVGNSDYVVLGFQWSNINEIIKNYYSEEFNEG